MRPIFCFDIESTGTDPATDRIVSIAIMGNPPASPVPEPVSVADDSEPF